MVLDSKRGSNELENVVAYCVYGGDNKDGD